MHAIAPRQVHVAAMVFDQGDAEMQLDVRAVESGMGFEKSAGLGDVARHQSGALALELPPAATNLRQHRWGEADEIAAGQTSVDRVIDMVLQVASDLRAVEHDVNAESAKMPGRADPRAHQQLRRAERAGANDDLSV